MSCRRRRQWPTRTTNIGRRSWRSGWRRLTSSGLWGGKEMSARAVVFIGMICVADWAAGTRRHAAVAAAAPTPVSVSGIGARQVGTHTPQAGSMRADAQPQLRCSAACDACGWGRRGGVRVGWLAAWACLGLPRADRRLVKVVFGVPDLVVGSLNLGDRQMLTTAAATGPFGGRITAIAPAADPRTRTFSVEVTISNTGNLLRPGMIATLVLSGSPEADPIPVVPLSAIVRGADDRSAFGVFILEQRGDEFFARARTVELGAAYANVIGLKSGLAPGDRVIVSGAAQVRDGQQVRVLR